MNSTNKLVFLYRAEIELIKISNMRKKMPFTAPKNVTIVTVSHWLEELVKQSFLSCHQVKTINNGIDTQIFAPKQNIREVRKKWAYVNLICS